MSKDLFHPLLKEYYFDLPSKLIARYPTEKRDQSRLMVIRYQTGEIIDSWFYKLPEFLKENDLLIGNHTYVALKRVFLKRKSGAKIETIFLERDTESSSKWKVLLKKARKLNNYEILFSEKNPKFQFQIHIENDEFFLEFIAPSNFSKEKNFFDIIGEVPIPPYLEREEERIDRERYQSIYAKQLEFSDDSYSSAAPTASFHFSEEVFKALGRKNIQFDSIRLNIGYGTFAPLREENFQNKHLHEETYSIFPNTVKKLKDTKNSNRIIAVGTTTLRAIESVHRKTQGRFDGFLTGNTDIFLHPPDNILSVDGLITNFHLPSSSLMLLVACMVPKDLLLKAYQHAMDNKYRFFSYGDAMLIIP